MDRRESRRFHDRLRVRMDPGAIAGQTEDISQGGLFLTASAVNRPGTRVRMLISLPGGTEEVQGVVRWVRRPPAAAGPHSLGGMGIEFTRVSARLAAYVDRLSTPTGSPSPL